MSKGYTDTTLVNRNFKKTYIGREKLWSVVTYVGVVVDYSLHCIAKFVVWIVLNCFSWDVAQTLLKLRIRRF